MLDQFAPDNPAASLVALADLAQVQEMEERQSHKTHTGITTLAPQIQGRAFYRLQQYALIPGPFREQADTVAAYLAYPAIRLKVFTSASWKHRHAVGPCVRGHRLVDAILDYLVRSPEENPSRTKASQVADLLVLRGFISPVREPNDEGDEVLTYMSDWAYYELIAPLQEPPSLHRHTRPQRRVVEPPVATTDLQDASKILTLSVWQVANGTIHAGTVFHKTNPSLLRSLLRSLSSCGLNPMGRERKCYVVINKTPYHTLFVFADDVSRRAEHCVPLRDALVQYDQGTVISATMYHGLKVWNEDHVERLDFMSNREQDDWILSILEGGAKYKETHPRMAELTEQCVCFFDLMDVDAHGDEVKMHQFRGNVVLLVNVASQDPEARLQYPELVKLANRYRDDGLVVLACPCDQFAGLELAIDTEVVDHVAITYEVDFPVLSIRDVNGPLAREPFVFANAHCPGVFGPFVEWNFTKFLIDRGGGAVRRYETNILPRELEADIQHLLQADECPAASGDTTSNPPAPDLVESE